MPDGCLCGPGARLARVFQQLGFIPTALSIGLVAASAVAQTRPLPVATAPTSQVSPGGSAKQREPAVEVASDTQRSPGLYALVARRVLGLRRCLELAERNYPKISEASARLDSKSAQERQAFWAPFTEFTATAGVGLAPTVRGLSTFSPNTDVTLSSSMALAWQVGVEGVLPLYTFGKLEHGWRALAAQTKAGEYEVKKEINDVRRDLSKST